MVLKFPLDCIFGLLYNIFIVKLTNQPKDCAMIKLVEVTDDLPEARGKSASVVKDFCESKMQTAKLDTSEDPRSNLTIHAGIYNYLRQHAELNVKVQMVEGEIYLTKITDPV